MYNPDRLTGPLQHIGERGGEAFGQITWNEGLGQVADRLDLLRAAGRGDRVCLLSQGVGNLAQSLVPGDLLECVPPVVASRCVPVRGVPKRSKAILLIPSVKASFAGLDSRGYRFCTTLTG